MRELGTAPGQRRQPLVRYLGAVAEEQPLHLRARARPGAAAQLAQHAPHRLVAARVLAAQRDRAPQDGLPGEVLPSVAHGRARAKVGGAQVREDLEHQLVAEPVEMRTDDGRRPGLRPSVFSGRRRPVLLVLMVLMVVVIVVVVVLVLLLLLQQRQVGATSAAADASTATAAPTPTTAPTGNQRVVSLVQARRTAP